MKNTELCEIQTAPRTASTHEGDLAKPFYATSAEQLRRLKRPNILTAPLSETERLIWTDFFPRIYSDMAYREEDLVEPNRQWGSLRDYDRCVIPAHILCQMREWRATNIFDAFEIRAQAIHDTAALFGYQDGKMWLLARWSEDDRELLSFPEVRQIVKRWSAVNRRRQVAVALVALLLGSVSLWVAFALHAWAMIVFGIFSSVVGIGAWNDECLGPSKELRQALNGISPERGSNNALA